MKNALPPISATFQNSKITGIKADRHPHDHAAYSLIEILIVVAVLGLLASVASLFFVDVGAGAEKVRLEADTIMVNRAVRMYIASGGNLKGVVSADQVVAHLKTSASVAQAGQIAGMKGPFVDLRLTAQPVDPDATWSAVWNMAGQHFEVSKSNRGVRFATDDTLSDPIVETEQRRVALALATKEKWVWDYSKNAEATRNGPSDISRGGGSTSGPGGPAAVSQLVLNPPQFNLGSRQFGSTDFPVSVTISNPNPNGSSEVFYRIDNGAWYAIGAPISLPIKAETRIDAYASPMNDDWLASNTSRQIYTFVPGTLTAPAITPSGGTFTSSEFPASFTLADSNPTGRAKLEYRIGGSAWASYTGTPVPLTVGEEVIVEARAVPIIAGLWVPSTLTRETYKLDQEALKPPTFAPAPGKYPSTDFPMTVTLANPNPANSSKLVYRRSNESSWQDYSGGISLAATDLVVTLEAKAVALQTDRWTDSTIASGLYEQTPVQLQTPQFTPPGGFFSWTDLPSAVGLTNPNPAGSSQIMVRINGGSWTPYAAGIPLPRDAFSTVIEAYAKSTNTDRFKDSTIRKETYETVFFTGSSQGFFHDPSPDEGRPYSSMKTNLPPPQEGPLFKWGKTEGQGLTQSSMLFSGTDNIRTLPGQWFYLGKIDYANGTINAGTGAGAVKMRFAFNITQPNADKASADYSFTLVNTPNTSNAQASADYVYIPNLAVEFTTQASGRKYKLDIRFGETTANGFSAVNEFHVYENKSASGSLYGRIVEVTP